MVCDVGATLGGKTGGMDEGATLGGRTEGIDADGGIGFVEDDGGEGNKSLRLRMVANLVKPL